MTNKPKTNQITLRTLSLKIINAPLKPIIISMFVVAAIGLMVKHVTSKEFKDAGCSKKYPSYVQKALTKKEIQTRLYNAEHGPSKLTPEQLRILKVSLNYFNGEDREVYSGVWSDKAGKCVQNAMG